jgi:hypothetical protein
MGNAEQSEATKYFRRPIRPLKENSSLMVGSSPVDTAAQKLTAIARYRDERNLVRPQPPHPKQWREHLGSQHIDLYDSVLTVNVPGIRACWKN